MAYLAAQTNVGTRKRVNEDACCIEVAQTAFGEVLMAIVCDGVGGLSRGDIASSTVVDRFVRWFELSLPTRIGNSFDFDAVRSDWDSLLRELNTTIRAYGLRGNVRLGTTFTGIIACAGHYLIGHVGDCRAYCLRAGAIEQLTVDQTAVARRLAAGEITQEEARRLPRNVISQAVGAQQGLEPVFTQGDVDADDLFVLCCDGAYHRIGTEGIAHLFDQISFRDEAALDEACREVIRYDLDHGERDNLTVLCFSGALADAAGLVPPARRQAAAAVPTAWRGGAAGVEDDVPTVVESEGIPSASLLDEDDAPTMLESDDFEDDAPTMVDADGFEDDAPTMIEAYGEDDGAPTLVELEPDEDEAPTMTEAGEDGDDVPTMVEAGEGAEEASGVARHMRAWPPTPAPAPSAAVYDEDDVPTMVEPAEADEDDAPTMVEPDDFDEDDAPTMVEGADA